MRENGSLIAFETGATTAYAMKSAQERGQMFIRPGVEVYEGQVIGIHQRPGDLKVNVCKTKALTNMRAASKDATVVLDEPKDMSLDDALEYIVDDEAVEVSLGDQFCNLGVSRGEERVYHPLLMSLGSLYVQVTPVSVRIRKMPQRKTVKK